MHHVLAPDGRRLFPKGVRLLTHWNLRDQIKADYSEPDRVMALARQRLIREGDGADRTQTIPKGVIDDPRVDWNPASNTVTASPPEEVETEQMKAQGKRPPQAIGVGRARAGQRDYAVLPGPTSAPRASSTRTRRWRPPRSTGTSSSTTRSEEQRVRALLTQVLESPLVPRVAP